VSWRRRRRTGFTVAAVAGFSGGGGGVAEASARKDIALAAGRWRGPSAVEVEAGASAAVDELSGGGLQSWV